MFECIGSDDFSPEGLLSTKTVPVYPPVDQQEDQVKYHDATESSTAPHIPVGGQALLIG
jgi:hypothetical protein